MAFGNSKIRVLAFALGLSVFSVTSYSDEPAKKPDAKKEKPSALDTAKNVGEAFLKDVGGDAGKFVDKLKEGYAKVYDEGMQKAIEKRNARIARGEKVNWWTDFKDGFTSTFYPSLKFSVTSWGLPLVKAIFRVMGAAPAA